MATSISLDNAAKAKGQEQDRRPLAIALDEDLALRLANFQRRNPDFAAMEEAARHILRLWLTENGYDGAHADLGRRPETLNASNDD